MYLKTIWAAMLGENYVMSGVSTQEEESLAGREVNEEEKGTPSEVPLNRALLLHIQGVWKTRFHSLLCILQSSLTRPKFNVQVSEICICM